MKEIGLEIDDKNPFKNCLFDRGIYYLILQNLIRNNSNGFVMALNNSWGTGKTTFINMFREDIKMNFDCIYINLWENDYESDPLIILLSELKFASKSIIKKKRNSNIEIDKVIKSGAKIVAGAGLSIVKGQLSSFIGKDIADKAIEFVEKDIIKNIEKVSDNKSNIQKFKNNLESFLSTRKKLTPLIIVIDELDRCKPDFAIKTLEIIKHFFDIPNITFILSIDKKNLEAAVKGYYGSDEIDGDDYLKKLIDIELSLPKPSIERLFESRLNNYPNDVHFIPSKSKEDLKNMLLKFYENEDISIRNLNKILNHQELVINSFTSHEKYDLYIISFLIYLKHQKRKLYLGFINNDDSVFSEVFEILNIKYFIDSPKINQVSDYSYKYLVLYCLKYFNIKKSRYNQYIIGNYKGILNDLENNVINANNQYLNKIEFLAIN